MFASAITWMSVPVSSLANIGLGKECGSSAATASPAGGRAPAEKSSTSSTINHHDQQPQVNNHQHSTGLIGNGPEPAYSHAVLSTAPCPAVGSSPQMATVSKSRPSSRRQSGAGGEGKRISFETRGDENAERHVKFNIGFGEWRRNTQTNLLSADTTFTSGLRRIRSSQVSLTSLVDGQPNTSQSTTQPNQPHPLTASHNMLTSTEDLTKFPSESLHSFSFSQPRDPTAILESRQSILRKSIDYMKEKLHGGAPTIPWAEPAITIPTTSDPLPMEIARDEDVLQSLKRANLIPEYWDETNLPPPTAPISVVENPFDNLETEPLTMPIRKKRTPTDVSSYRLQAKLFDAVTRPFSISTTTPLMSPSTSPQNERRLSLSLIPPPTQVPGVVPVRTTTRLAPTMQAIFSTEPCAPWKILNANDLACLEFGMSEQDIKKGVSIIDCFDSGRREWLQERLVGRVIPADVVSMDGTENFTQEPVQEDTSKPTEEAKERVLLCGEVVSMRKIRAEQSQSATMAASLWVKEKKEAFIWVIEPISNAIATISINPKSEKVIASDGQITAIFGREIDDLTISDILPFLDRDDKGHLEWSRISWKARYCANFEDGAEGQGWIPCTIEVLKTDLPASEDSEEDGKVDLRVSYLPHIAGVLVLDAKTLTITSSNSAFSSTLFGRRNLCGLEIGEVLPNFRRLVHFLAKEQNQQKLRREFAVSDEDDDVEEDKQAGLILEEGTVVPEHAFRRAEAMLELRQAAGVDMSPSTSSSGSTISSESETGEVVGTLSLDDSEESTPSNKVGDDSSEKSDETPGTTPGPVLGEGLLSGGLLIKPHGLCGVHRDGGEVVVDVQMRVVRPTSESGTVLDNIYYALWITYSGPRLNIPPLTPLPPVEPKPQLKKPEPQPFGTSDDTFSSDDEIAPEEPRRRRSSVVTEPTGIDAWEVTEEMGEGAYGSVKLVRYRRDPSRKTAIMKYVTKARILVDTWTRDRVLGTVPLEIHILNFIKSRRHRNLVEMISFFEDDKHYYVEMTPFGRPGTDLFDWIELHTAMTETEAKSIFHQTCAGIEHLHTVCGIVHRDIKDENVVLDTCGRVKVIDFGSAAYIKDGPFDTFHGTLDYASPEVLGGKKYEGRAQDVWAAGILLYTMIYKENPFYNIDEIVDRDLRIPFVMSEDSIDLIRKMLDRDLTTRPTMSQVLAHPWFEDVIELDWAGVR